MFICAKDLFVGAKHGLADKTEHGDRFVCENGLSGGLENIIKHGMHFELLHDVQQLAEVLKEQYAVQFGPRLSVEGPARASMNKPHILTFNFDQDDWTSDPFKLTDIDDWHDTGLARAATAYRRSCHWDFAPGEAGTWLCYYLITDGSGGNEHWWYNGNLVGFLILYDRNETGKYESLGHIWTAAAARRRGVAKTLVAHARKHFPLTRVEGPLTGDGKALFKTMWPEIVAHLK